MTEAVSRHGDLSFTGLMHDTDRLKQRCAFALGSTEAMHLPQKCSDAVAIAIPSNTSGWKSRFQRRGDKHDKNARVDSSV